MSVNDSIKRFPNSAPVFRELNSIDVAYKQKFGRHSSPTILIDTDFRRWRLC